MSYEIEGILEEISQTMYISETFKKRDFVLKVVGHNNYEDFIKFEAHQDRVDRLDQVQVGSQVTVKFSVGGRKWINPQGEIKIFNTLKAFYISSNQQSGNPQQPSYTPPENSEEIPI